jgi:hypothetical protein
MRIEDVKGTDATVNGRGFAVANLTDGGSFKYSFFRLLISNFLSIDFVGISCEIEELMARAIGAANPCSFLRLLM